MFTIYYRNLCSYVQSHNLNPTTGYDNFRNGITGLQMGSISYPLNNAPIFYISGDNRNPWHTRYNLDSKVGSGTTSPTNTDYKPDVDQTSNFSNYNTDYLTSSDGQHVTTRITITGTNTTNSSITLTEVMVYKICISNNGNVISLWVPVARELLDTPKVVPPNESFTLTLDWVD